jgi:hypothetical protein
MSQNLITESDLLELQRSLAIEDLFRDDTDPTILRQLVMRFEHVKVQIYSEKGPHKRPHFHIEFKRQFRASYAIDTLERIIGYMPRRYEDRVIEWARTVKPQLSECWQRIAAGGEPLDFEVDAGSEG